MASEKGFKSFKLCILPAFLILLLSLVLFKISSFSTREEESKKVDCVYSSNSFLCESTVMRLTKLLNKTPTLEEKTWLRTVFIEGLETQLAMVKNHHQISNDIEQICLSGRMSTLNQSNHIFTVDLKKESIFKLQLQVLPNKINEILYIRASTGALVWAKTSILHKDCSVAVPESKNDKTIPSDLGLETRKVFEEARRGHPSHIQKVIANTTFESDCFLAGCYCQQAKNVLSAIPLSNKSYNQELIKLLNTTKLQILNEIAGSYFPLRRIAGLPRKEKFIGKGIIYSGAWEDGIEDDLEEDVYALDLKKDDAQVPGTVYVSIECGSLIVNKKEALMKTEIEEFNNEKELLKKIDSLDFSSKACPPSKNHFICEKASTILTISKEKTPKAYSHKLGNYRISIIDELLKRIFKQSKSFSIDLDKFSPVEEVCLTGKDVEELLPGGEKRLSNWDNRYALRFTVQYSFAPNWVPKKEKLYINTIGGSILYYPEEKSDLITVKDCKLQQDLLENASIKITQELLSNIIQSQQKLRKPLKLQKTERFVPKNIIVPADEKEGLIADNSMIGRVVTIFQLIDADLSEIEKGLIRKGYTVKKINRITLESLKSVLEESNQVWIFSAQYQVFSDEFLAEIYSFNEKGGAIYLLGDNDNWYVDSNFVAEKLMGVELKGDILGENNLTTWKNKNEEIKGGFNEEHPIFRGISTFNEGITVSEVTGNLHNVETIAYNSEGTPLISTHEDGNNGRLIIDGGFSRYFGDYFDENSVKLAQNIAGWLSGADMEM